MTLKSAFKAIGTDTTEPCLRTAFDHFIQEESGLNSQTQSARAGTDP
jgi:hypothetical protein